MKKHPFALDGLTAFWQQKYISTYKEKHKAEFDKGMAGKIQVFPIGRTKSHITRHHHPTSFPTHFQTIRANEYAIAILGIFGTIMERSNFYTHEEQTVMMLLGYNPYVPQTSKYRS